MAFGRKYPTVFVLVGALSLAGCGDQASTFSDSYSFWKATDEAEKAYPKLKPYQARRKYAIDTFREISKRAKTLEEKRMIAASFYSGFSQLNGQAIPAYCAEMKIDISPFAKKFARTNSRSEKALEAVLAEHGLTKEQVWEKQKRRARTVAKNALLEAAGLSGTWEVCDAVRDNPQKFMARANFAREYPAVAQALTRRAASD
jgi:hypothetical protein